MRGAWIGVEAKAKAIWLVEIVAQNDVGRGRRRLRRIGLRVSDKVHKRAEGEEGSFHQ